MWPAIRVLAAVIAVGSFILSKPLISEQQEARTEWRQQERFDRASEKPPIEATIAELYFSPPEPSRRVVLLDPVSVRDTLRHDRPVIMPDGRRMDIAEELVFVEDSRTGQRLAILKTVGEPSDPWIELMPMPRDVERVSPVARWTPLAHWRGVWLPGWADANEPYDFMWLGVTSDVLRTRDVAGPVGEAPYRVRESIRAGSPGGPPAPGIVSLKMIALWVFGLMALIVAAFGRLVFVRRPVE